MEIVKTNYSNNIYMELYDFFSRIYTTTEINYIRPRRDITKFIYINYGIDLSEEKCVISTKFKSIDNIPVQIVFLNEEQTDVLNQNETLGLFGYHVTTFIGAYGNEIILLIPHQFMYINDNDDVKERFRQLRKLISIFISMYKIQLLDKNLMKFNLIIASSVLAIKVLIDCNVYRLDDFEKVFKDLQIKTSYGTIDIKEVSENSVEDLLIFRTINDIIVDSKGTQEEQ